MAVGDRVRIVTRTSPKVGETGGVTHVAGRSVVIELDRPYMAAGTPQRLYYSYPGELELIPRVGRMGAVDLFLDEEDAIDDGDAYSPGVKPVNFLSGVTPGGSEPATTVTAWCSVGLVLRPAGESLPSTYTLTPPQ